MEEREFKTLAENDDVKIKMNVKKEVFVPLLEREHEICLDVHSPNDKQTDFWIKKSDVLECMQEFNKERAEILSLLSDTFESYKQGDVSKKELRDIIKDVCYSFSDDVLRIFGEVKGVVRGKRK